MSRLTDTLLCLFAVFTLAEVGYAADLPCTGSGEKPVRYWREVSEGILEQMDTRRGTASRRLKLLAPMSVAASDANLYVFDAGHHAVFRFDLARETFSLLYALPPQTVEGDIYVHEDASVYVTEEYGARVVEFDAGGRVAQVYQDEAMTRPRAVVAGAANLDVFIANAIGSYVLVFSRSGLLVDSMGTGRNILFEAVTALARKDEVLYVLDASTPGIHVFERQRDYVGVWGEDELQRPRSIAVDEDARVFVLDGNAIRIFSHGEYRTTLRGDGRTDFSFVTDIWTSAGFLYVADGAGGRVLIFTIPPSCG